MKPFILYILLAVSASGVCQNTDCFDLSYENEVYLNLPKNKKIYFLGETHNISSNELLDFVFIKYLNKTEGVKTFLKEGSYTYIYFLNEYLKTKDKTILDQLSDNYYVKEEYEFLDSLYMLNLSLPANEQISIYSIDAVLFYHMDNLISYWFNKYGSPKNKEVKSALETLASIKVSKFSFDKTQKEKKEIKRIIDEVKGIHLQEKTAFENFLKQDYIHLKMIIDNYATIKRTENALFNNFLNLHSFLNNRNYYISYGRLHAQKKGGWLADKLNNSNFSKDMLTSIMPFYESSKMYWGGKSIDIDNSNEISESDISNLIEKGCEKEWILHPSLEKEYDFILLGKNQKGITVINK